MPEPIPREVNDLAQRYKRRIAEELGTAVPIKSVKISSREYAEFREDLMPKHMTRYEQWCNWAGKNLKIKPSAKEAEQTWEHLRMCHLKTDPTGVLSFAILAGLIILLGGTLGSYIIFQSFSFIMNSLMLAGLGMYSLKKYPEFLANSWRMKSSNQMVLSVFYVVTHMRHSSNLELAIAFASDHLAPPLNLDMRKVLWDVETEKFETITDSLENYLTKWKKYNMEFVEAFHLIESSLLESSEEKRVQVLDKSLDVILNGTYENMLHYAHNLKSPITMLHMLGVIMPILGLVILPLIVAFIAGDIGVLVVAGGIMSIYNIFIPVMVFVMGKNILSKRPSGYGDSDISETSPALKKLSRQTKILGMNLNMDPKTVAMMVAGIFILIGISPILLHLLVADEYGLGFGGADPISPCGFKFCVLGYQPDENTGGTIGPFGLVASVLSVAIILGIGLGVGMYYKMKTKNIMELRTKSKKLEKEFASGLFQLGNRLGDGMPPEMAIGRVAQTLEGSTAGSFFQMVSINIQKLGMSVQQAIFDPEHGAINYFPSALIRSSMKVLVESAKKGPQIAAQALMNVSRYIKEIHKVDERLKDLLADIVGSMNSQVKFLTPLIAAIVVGIASMITSILGKLGAQIGGVGGESGGGGGGVLDLFGAGMPTYFFQIIVGLYVLQIIYILTILANGIENGEDKLNEKYTLGVNVTKGAILYSFIAITVMVLFNIIAVSVLTGTV